MKNKRYLNKVNSLNRVNTLNRVNRLFTCLPCLPTFEVTQKTDTPHLHFEGLHPLETTAFPGENNPHMIVNHGKGRGK